MRRQPQMRPPPQFRLAVRRAVAIIRTPQFSEGYGGVPCDSTRSTSKPSAFEITRKRRKRFSSEARVKRGDRVVPGNKEPIEKLGRNDPCPCGSGGRFQALLHAFWRIRWQRSGLLLLVRQDELYRGRGWCSRSAPSSVCFRWKVSPFSVDSLISLATRAGLPPHPTNRLSGLRFQPPVRVSGVFTPETRSSRSLPPRGRNSV
jgi:hypothetical protein